MPLISPEMWLGASAGSKPEQDFAALGIDGIGATASLFVVLGVLALGIVASLLFPGKREAS
jgi:hypothetical protein